VAHGISVRLAENTPQGRQVHLAFPPSPFGDIRSTAVAKVFA
jgi:hypothetical protein